MSSCPTCDAPVTPEDRFCGNCGMAQPPAASTSPREGAARAAAAGEGYSGGAGDVSSAPLGDEESQNLSAPSAEPSGDPGGAALDPQFQPTIINGHNTDSGAEPAHDNPEAGAAEAGAAAAASGPQ